MALPAITTYSPGVLGPTFLQARGNITSTGGKTIKRKGFVYSLSSHGDPGNTKPELSDYEFMADEKGSFVSGNFEIYLSNLNKTGDYFIRAFCQNFDGYVYGSQVAGYTLSGYYPNATYNGRFRENKQGVNYLPSDSRRIYATDLQNYDDEIIAIETELGTRPKGSDASVKARLTRLDAQAGWKYVQGANFTGALSITGLNGDKDQAYKIVMRGYRSTRTNIWLRFNNDSNSRYSYHNGVRGYISLSLVNSHAYNRRTTAILMNRTALPYFWIEATINVNRNGFVSVTYDSHCYESDEDYEFTDGNGLYDYITSNISSLNFQFSGILGSGSYRFYKLY